MCGSDKAFELGNDHMVIIFLEVSGIKSASLDEKSPVGAQPKIYALSLTQSNNC